MGSMPSGCCNTKTLRTSSASPFFSGILLSRRATWSWSSGFLQASTQKGSSPFFSQRSTPQPAASSIISPPRRFTSKAYTITIGKTTNLSSVPGSQEVGRPVGAELSPTCLVFRGLNYYKIDYSNLSTGGPSQAPRKGPAVVCHMANVWVLLLRSSSSRPCHPKRTAHQLGDKAFKLSFLGFALCGSVPF